MRRARVNALRVLYGFFTPGEIMRGRILTVAVALALAGCGPGEPDDTATTPADTLTRDQRDSIIGASGLPGASAIERARETSQTAAERAARMDSIQP